MPDTLTTEMSPHDALDAHTFVFLTGLHRSGTSPLHRCLRHHPQISGFHDTGVAEDEGQHLQTVLPRGGAYGGPGRFGRHPDAHMTETHPLATEEMATALFDQWQPYWDLSKPYLVEKTPITLLRTRLFQALFPRSYFVVIVRHPAAVALATYNALASFQATYDLTVADLIEHWCSNPLSNKRCVWNRASVLVATASKTGMCPQQGEKFRKRARTHER